MDYSSTVAFVCYDFLDSQFDDIRTNLNDLTLFKLQHPQYNCSITYTNTISDTLADLADKGLTWAVVVASGNWVEETRILIDTIDAAVKCKASLAGHLNQDDEFYCIHPQYFAINLVEWTLVGRPAFEVQEGSQVYNSPLYRNGNIHDDDNPFFLVGVGKKYTFVTQTGQFGSRVIEKLLGNNKRVMNVLRGSNVRQLYSYPESNHDLLTNMIHDMNYLPDVSPDDKVYAFVKKVADESTQMKNKFYVVNTEKFITNDQLLTTKFDHFVGVCGGLKPAALAGAGNFIPDAKICLIDVSTAGLEWQQYLIENWDGTFATFNIAITQFLKIHPDYIPCYHTNYTIERNLLWFLESAEISEDMFIRRWKKYKQCSFQYINLNLLDDDANIQLLQLIKNAANAYIWFSNSFYMDYLVFYKTKDGAAQLKDLLIDKLRGTRTNIFLEESERLHAILKSD